MSAGEGFIILLVLMALYFIPTFIAFNAGKNNKEAILLLNLFLGWTFIGWVVALVWATTQDKK